MTQQLIIVQHHPAERASEIGTWAERHGIALDEHRADLG
jgi:hypothetical protein